jgi:hypothetical protein
MMQHSLATPGLASLRRLTLAEIRQAPGELASLDLDA